MYGVLIRRKQEGQSEAGVVPAELEIEVMPFRDGGRGHWSRNAGGHGMLDKARKWISF